MKPQHMDQALIDKARRASLVEVVGRHVRLQRRGDEYIWSCPFHGERTPSFTIVPAKNFYHCFGCGAHGDALRFVMDNERLKVPRCRRSPCRQIPARRPRGAGRAKDRSLRTSAERRYRTQAPVGVGRVASVSAGRRHACGELSREPRHHTQPPRRAARGAALSPLLGPQSNGAAISGFGGGGARAGRQVHDHPSHFLAP